LGRLKERTKIKAISNEKLKDFVEKAIETDIFIAAEEYDDCC